MSQLSGLYVKNKMINNLEVVMVKHDNDAMHVDQVLPEGDLFCVQLARCSVYDSWHLPKAIKNFSESINYLVSGKTKFRLIRTAWLVMC